MGYDAISLLVFAVIIIITVLFDRVNMGILALGVAIVVGHFGGMTDAAIVGGLNMNVFFIMLACWRYFPKDLLC